jgi:asparagine synthase (glutamine-hydrolysing)
MPGIFGFINPVHGNLNQQLLAAMADALRDESFYQKYLYEDSHISMGRVGLDIVHPFSQPAWNEAHTVAVVLEGEIYDYTEHRILLERAGYFFETASHAELFTHFYEEVGVDFIAHVHGVFAAAIWDQISRKLVLVNDHMALQPLYYTPNQPENFAFASGVRALLAMPELPRNLDRLAVAQFLTFDHVLDDHTLLNDVKQLPAATILTASDGNISMQKYWRPQYPEYYSVRSKEEYGEELQPLLRQAFQRQKPGEQTAAVLLSGGLDSRVVAAELKEIDEGEPLQTFTFGKPGCDDVRYAREVSRKLGISNYFFTLENDYLIHYANKGVRLSDGLANVIHMHTLPNLNDQASRAQVIYKGFLGDALMGYGIPGRLWANFSDEDLTLVHIAALQEIGGLVFEPSLLDQVLLPQPEGLLYEQVISSLKRAYRASQTPLAADQRHYLDLTQRVPRMTLAGVEWVRSQAHVRLPFADKELIEFMLTVPPGFRYQRKIMKDLFVRKYPELAKIPFTETGYPLVHCRREVTKRAGEQMCWWLRAAGMKWVPMPQKHSYAHYAEWFRDELRDWMCDILLSKRCLERGIFNPVFVKNLITEHLAGTNHHIRLGGLIAIELWHQQFID